PGPAAQRRQEPDRFRTTENTRGRLAKWAGRAVRRLRPRGQSAAAGALRPCRRGFLANADVAVARNLADGLHAAIAKPERRRPLSSDASAGVAAGRNPGSPDAARC